MDATALFSKGQRNLLDSEFFNALVGKPFDCGAVKYRGVAP
jgi:hypothetical protein